MQIRHLERDNFDAAARLFADAFLDDPGWVAVGPDSRRRRHANLRRYHRTALDVIERHGGPIYGAFDEDEGSGGRLTGVAATFAAGLYPPPAWTIVQFVPGFLLAGPGPIVRGLQFSAVQEKGHPHDEHVYLWFLAVDPSHQRGGVGRALLARVYADAGASAYLDTANPANVPYYVSNGYQELGRADGPRGASMWFMMRPR
jgi:ribosomal protein S18 acetylase RimI-like enzyme